MIKKSFILFTLSALFTGCYVSHIKNDTNQADFAKRNTVLIKEMAEYAVLFCLENKINAFETDNIKSKKARKKMEQLGNTVTVTYQNGSGHIPDSTVIFKSITVLHGVIEFIYDFAVTPRNEGNEGLNNKETTLIQVSERIYYRRRPFPMM